MNVSFYLAHNGTIMASVSSQVGRLRVSIGDKCNKIHWKSGHAVVSQAYDGRELNTRLKKIEMWWIDTIRRQQNDGVMTRATLTEAWMDYIGRRRKRSVTQQPEMIDYFDRWIKSVRYSPGRVYHYTRTRELLLKSGLDLRWGAVSVDWYNAWCEFLSREVGCDSSATLYIATVKHLINEAFEAGVTDTVEHKKKYFKARVYDSDQVYLTADEVRKLYELKIDNPVVSYRRDMFVLTCYTGFRYSDWVKYRPENVIEGGKMLRVRQKKTGAEVVVPLHPIAREILDRHFKSPYGFPSNGTMNYNIKKVARMMGLTGEVTRSRSVRGQLKSVTMSKFEAISCHTARRSFATNAYLAGLPVKTIMAFTGHRTIAAFERYIRVTQLEAAIKAAQHPFFCG